MTIYCLWASRYILTFLLTAKDILFSLGQVTSECGRVGLSKALLFLFVLFQFQIKMEMDDQDHALAKHGHVKGLSCWLWVSDNGNLGDCYPTRVDRSLVAAVAACLVVAAIVGYALYRCKYNVPHE